MYVKKPRKYQRETSLESQIEKDCAAACKRAELVKLAQSACQETHRFPEAHVAMFSLQSLYFAMIFGKLLRCCLSSDMIHAYDVMRFQNPKNINS